MKGVSKRLRKKKEFSGLHPSPRVKVKKLTVFLTPPPFSLFPTEITRQFPQMLTPGPGLSNPDLLA